MVGREQVDLRRALEGGQDRAVGGIPFEADEVTLQAAARHVGDLFLRTCRWIELPDLVEREE
jgi:hypothetical protein